jgi:4-diphosphocytidyl-2-C-methyl-D-erythritol kinase
VFPADDFSVSVTGTVELSRVPTDGSNIAIRAARLLAARTGHVGGVRIEIDKHVPVTGGMGGGSADAAATLLACDALWGTGLPRDEMLGLARELGADVPFAFTGGTAIGTGRGDELSPALAAGQFHWVLAVADFGLSTPEVYRELDLHRERHAQDIFPAPVAPSVDPNVLQALRAGDPHMLAECLHNDLQAAALHLEPALAQVLELGEANGALAGIVSGSGPTVAFLTADVDSALELQVALSASRLTVVRASGPVHGARIVTD